MIVLELGLGTVQFGQDYGISNSYGQTPIAEVAQIFDLANDYGIKILDTAALYGASEEVLGKVLRRNHNFSIVTKTKKYPKYITRDEANHLENSLHDSLRKMRQDSVYGLLFHDAANLIDDNEHLLYDRMISLKEKGLVKKIGVSVYTEEQINSILDQFKIDLIQIPMNVLDQRLLVHGILDMLNEKGIEIHVRSVFLQGLLLMNPNQLPQQFYSMTEDLKEYHHDLTAVGLTPLSAALQFVTTQRVDCALVGVTTKQELQEVLRATELNRSSPALNYAKYACHNEKIVNPALWS